MLEYLEAKVSRVKHLLVRVQPEDSRAGDALGGAGEDHVGAEEVHDDGRERRDAGRTHLSSSSTQILLAARTACMNDKQSTGCTFLLTVNLTELDFLLFGHWLKITP